MKLCFRKPIVFFNGYPIVEQNVNFSKYCAVDG
jgi:hypothetical protein